MLLTDEEIRVPNLVPPKDDPDLYLRIGRMNTKAQLKKVVEWLGITQEIVDLADKRIGISFPKQKVQSLLEEVKDATE